MVSTNRLHALTKPDEAPEMSPFDSLMAASGLSAPSSPLDEQSVLSALGRFFRLAGTLTRIPTEKDDTFVLDGNQDRLLVKVSGAQEAPCDVNLQTTALLHIAETAPTLPIPAVLQGTDGEYEYDLSRADADAARVLRVMKFLPGSALSDSHPTREQMAAVGRAQAAITEALSGFTHSRQDRNLVWDLRNFSVLRPLLDRVAAPEDRRLGERIFDAYAEHVQGRIPQLRHQVVHGDFSAHNILVDGDRPEYVSGIIDFGDTTPHSRDLRCRHIDVESARCPRRGPMAQRPRLVLRVLPIAARSTVAELSLLPIAVASRSLQRALIACWRAQQDPLRAEYVLSHAAHDWIVLRSIGTTWSPVVDRINSVNESSIR